MLCLLLLQSLGEIKEALAVFVANSLLPVVCHLVSHCYLALVWGLDVHLLGQELDLLLMEIARADQLRPVNPLLVTRYVGSCLALHSPTGRTLRLHFGPLIASLEEHRPGLRLGSLHQHLLLVELRAY